MLIADIHQARSLATMKQKTYQIAFGTNAYSVLQLAPLQTVHTRAMPSGVACSASDTATFFPWGLTVPVAVTVVSVHDTTVLQISANGSVSHD